MKCRPGDLCRILGGDPILDQLKDRFITVTRCVPHRWSGVPCWEYEGSPLFVIVPLWGPCDVRTIADRCLQPMRDPDFDASAEDKRDETLTPKRQVENAR